MTKWFLPTLTLGFILCLGLYILFCNLPAAYSQNSNDPCSAEEAAVTSASNALKEAGKDLKAAESSMFWGGVGGAVLGSPGGAGGVLLGTAIVGGSQMPNVDRAKERFRDASKALTEANKALRECRKRNPPKKNQNTAPDYDASGGDSPSQPPGQDTGPNSDDEDGGPNTQDADGAPNTDDDDGSPNTDDGDGSPNSNDGDGSPNTDDDDGSPNTNDDDGSPNTEDDNEEEEEEEEDDEHSSANIPLPPPPF